MQVVKLKIINTFEKQIYTERVDVEWRTFIDDITLNTRIKQKSKYSVAKVKKSILIVGGLVLAKKGTGCAPIMNNK